MDLARLASVDDELDRFGIAATRLDAVRARARAERVSLAEADAALSSLTIGVETLLPSEGIPEGAVAKPGSWDRRSEPPIAGGSGLVEVDPSQLEDAQLPPALTEPPPPSGDEVEVNIPRAPLALEEGDRPSVEITIEGDRPSVELTVEPGVSALFDDDEGTQVHGHSIGIDASEAAMAPSALELELEGEPSDLPASTTQSSAKFSVPHDSPHPSPKSVIPPPPPSADLDAELASILADELERPAEAAPDVADELEPEATALFSADMFGASEEPSLAELVSRPPPPDVDGSRDPDSLEIEIDDDVLVYEAEAQPVPPPTGTRPPPPPPRSAPPPPGKPGFLGRLLNRKG